MRARALACLRSAQYQRGGVLLLGASLAACIQKKTTGNGKWFASPETCAEVRRSKKMHLFAPGLSLAAAAA